MQTGGPWDYKKQINNKLGSWLYDEATKTRFNFDIWGNINYGYIGIKIGLSRDLLLFAAGVVQTKTTGIAPAFLGRCMDSGLSNACLPALDDPADQVAVSCGMNLWHSYKTNITGEILLECLRANRHQLNTTRS